jgi:hypothetical protein
MCSVCYLFILVSPCLFGFCWFNWFVLLLLSVVGFVFGSACTVRATLCVVVGFPLAPSVFVCLFVVEVGCLFLHLSF